MWLKVSAWHNWLIISEIQLLCRNSSLARIAHGNTSHEGLLAEHKEAEKEEGKWVAHTKTACAKIGRQLCSFQADLRDTSRFAETAEIKGYIFSHTITVQEAGVPGLTLRGAREPFSLGLTFSKDLRFRLAWNLYFSFTTWSQIHWNDGINRGVHMKILNTP